jgi:nicotinamide-nucleotide amidase
MKAEVISIGTEILLGHIVNTNASYLSERLAELGIDVYYHTAVGDNPHRLEESIRKSVMRSDIVITTGGLGPTVDDITTETVARLINKPLILDKAILKGLKEYFRIRKYKYPPGNTRQAYIPEGAKWVANKVGTAPGLIIPFNRLTGKPANRQTIICLPGPPRELEPMFERQITPYIRKLTGGWNIRSRTIKTTGLAESQVNGMVKDLLNLKPPTTVGIYAKLKEVDLKITAKAEDEKAAGRAIMKIEKKIRSRLKDYIFGCDDERLEDAVAEKLFKKRLTIAVAESCTGGLISNRLTDVSGSSKYFLMGLVAYSNLVKAAGLGVNEKTLKKYGAVSRQVAIEMARGIKQVAGSDIGLGITGIAGPSAGSGLVPSLSRDGPTGGTKSKPVGLVYIALVKGDRKRGLTQTGYSMEQGLTPFVREFRFKGTRSEIKFQASQSALDLLRRNL